MNENVTVLSLLEYELLASPTSNMMRSILIDQCSDHGLIVGLIFFSFAFEKVNFVFKSFTG